MKEHVSSSFENKTIKIKAILKEWSLEATFHCYPKLFQPYTGPKAKLVWVLILFSFMCLTIWFMSKAMIEFVQNETISKIEMITENPSPFPSITICNNSPFTTRKAELLYENVSAKHNISIRSALPLIKLLVGNNQYFSDTQRKELGFNLTESLVSCSFNVKNCNVSDFHYVYNYHYGNCFEFNHEMNLTSRLPGKTYGLNLLIGPLYNSNRNAIDPSNGLVIFIHNKTNPPSLFDDPVLIETGKETNVAVRRTFTQNSPWPYSECTDELFETELARYIQSVNKHYKQSHCFDLCLQKLIIDECKCYSSAVISMNSLRPCLNFTEYECIVKQFLDYIDKKLDYCKFECRLECDSLSYDVSMSSLSFPSRSYLEYFIETTPNLVDSFERITNKTFGYEAFKESYIYMNIFYPSLKYTQIVQSPKTSLIDLISNMGGLLGIFLGLSIFSLVEIVEIILRILWIYFGH